MLMSGDYFFYFLKKTMWKYRIIILVLILGFIVILTSIGIKQHEQPKVVTIHDTITDIKFDTVFLDHYSVVKLPIYDTLTQIIVRDSVIQDSVFVQVPIYQTEVEKSFTTDTTKLGIKLIMKGYDVSLDTLVYNFTYTPTPTKQSRFGFFAGPLIGIGINGKPSIGVGVGIGYKL